MWVTDCSGCNKGIGKAHAPDCPDKMGPAQFRDDEYRSLISKLQASRESLVRELNRAGEDFREIANECDGPAYVIAIRAIKRLTEALATPATEKRDEGEEIK